MKIKPRNNDDHQVFSMVKLLILVAFTIAIVVFSLNPMDYSNINKKRVQETESSSKQEPNNRDETENRATEHLLPKTPE